VDNKEVVLFSGGMDSLIAWEYLGNPCRLYVNLKHRYSVQERLACIGLCPIEEPKRFIYCENDIGMFFEKEDAEIPMRNLFLAMMAAWKGFDKIWISVQRDEKSIPDRTRKFFDNASSFLSFLNGRLIQVDTPFPHKDKVQMVDWYIKAGKSIERLKDTWACYNPVNGQPCANCGACFRRFVAFKLNGIEEDWFEKLRGSEVVSLYEKRAKEGYYGMTRDKYILDAIGML
jgi:7-cyano-7-deazaguanine synthase